MGVKEKAVEQEILLEGSKEDFILYRNNVGMAYTGVLSKDKKSLLRPRPIKFGLKKGSGDYIGYKKITITEDMVGKELAVFVSVEAKSKTGRGGSDQLNWRDSINYHNGMACICKSASDLFEAWNSFYLNLTKK